MSFTDYTHDERPLRLTAGDDAVRSLRQEVERLGGRRVMVIASNHVQKYADVVEEMLGDLFAVRCTEVIQHVPRQTVDAAQDLVDAHAVDCCVAIGGGSPIGLAKGLALRTDDEFPIIAIPTTYSGSEATKIWGISEGGRKTTGRDPRVAPRTIMHVPSWTVSLPRHISAASGVNAMAHCVEALYAVDRTPMTDLMSYEGIRALGSALPSIMENPEDIDARAEALWGAYLAGRALDAASLGLHHKLAHVLGGSFSLPHAPTHAVILPYATAYNADAAPSAMAEIASALGRDDGDAPAAIFALNKRLGIPGSLLELGFSEDDIEQAVNEVLEKEYPNPQPVRRNGVTRLLTDAVRGKAPGRYGETS